MDVVAEVLFRVEQPRVAERSERRAKGVAADPDRDLAVLRSAHVRLHALRDVLQGADDRAVPVRTISTRTPEEVGVEAFVRGAAARTVPNRGAGLVDGRVDEPLGVLDGGRSCSVESGKWVSRGCAYRAEEKRAEKRRKVPLKQRTIKGLWSEPIGV